MSESLTLELKDGRELIFSEDIYDYALRITPALNNQAALFMKNSDELRELLNALRPYAKKTPEQLAEEESKRLPVGCRVKYTVNGNRGTVKSNSYPAENDSIHAVIKFDDFIHTHQTMTKNLTREDDE